METLKLEKIQASKTNPRKHFHTEAMQELVASVKAHGVLQPILVRGVNSHYELVAGERRWRAAKLAGLVEIPAIVRELTDKETLEIQVIENLQRSDLHPMEEAGGYQQLMRAGYEVAKIAERVGRSVKYVYDRVKLLNLTPALTKAFLEGKITAGHAILLARLSPADQDRIDDRSPEYNAAGLWQNDHGLFDREEEDHGHLKCCSVRELQAWIDTHVKFDMKAADPMLFPETVTAVQTSAEKAETIVQITSEYQVRPDAKQGTERVFGPTTWRRADGTKGCKPCEHAVTGVIVVGLGRGEAFKVCTEKKKCAIHWKEELKASQQRAKRMATGEGNSQDRWRKEQELEKAKEAKREAARAAWAKMIPAIQAAIAAAVKKAPTGSKAFGQLEQLVLEKCDRTWGRETKAMNLVPRGKTSEDLIRHAAFLLLIQLIGDWDAPNRFPKMANALGVDVNRLAKDPGTPEKADGKAKAGK